MTNLDSTIARLARSQHGVMHRRQLLAAGLSARQIHRRVQRGHLIALGNGVVAVPSAPATTLRQYKAAELSIDGAALAGLAGAHLLGLTNRTAPPEIAVKPGGGHRCGFGRVHRRTDITTTVVKNIRVTAVDQTLVDIVGRLSIERVETIWSGALIRNRADLDAITERVQAAESQRLGNRGLARVMLDAHVKGDDRSESELEALLLDLVRTVPDVPEIVPQLALPWWKNGAGRADIGIPAWRLILEADGRSWHARLRDFDRDRERDNLAVAAGHVVLRFSALHLQKSPDSVVDLVARTGIHRAVA